jgi:ABC-type transport system involved in cytochrome bd biosynthesis fused ATPase/permease subunit
MRLCPAKKANIDPELRKTFERYGCNTMQIVLGSESHFYHEGADQRVDKYRNELLKWLTEEYEKAEFRHTYTTLMEFSIMVLVLVEVLKSFHVL